VTGQHSRNNFKLVQRLSQNYSPDEELCCDVRRFVRSRCLVVPQIPHREVALCENSRGRAERKPVSAEFSRLNAAPTTAADEPCGLWSRLSSFGGSTIRVRGLLIQRLAGSERLVPLRPVRMNSPDFLTKRRGRARHSPAQGGLTMRRAQSPLGPIARPSDRKA
jgi:hypothetical protein